MNSDLAGLLDAAPVAGLLVVAAVLVAESGTRIGVLVPTATPIAGLGWVAGSGALSVPVTIAVCAVATSCGVAWGHRRASAPRTSDPAPEPLPSGRGSGRAARLVTRSVTRSADRLGAAWTTRLSAHPVLASAAAQFVAGSRTLSPRLAAQRGIPLRTVLTGSVPAATAWTSALVLLGALAGQDSSGLGAAGAVLGLPLLVAVAVVLVLRDRWRRRARRTPAPAGVRVRLRGPRWAVAVAASSVTVLAVAVPAAPGSAVAVSPAGLVPVSASTVPVGPPPAAPPVTAPAPTTRDRVLAARDAYGLTGALGVAVVDTRTTPSGGTSAATPDAADLAQSLGAAAWMPDRPFHTASLVKLYLAEGVLHAARASGTPVSATDAGLIQAMLTSSDDDAASQLWVEHDGPALVTEVATRYGLEGTRPPARAGQWGETVTTAADLATFLHRLPDVAAAEDAAFMSAALSAIAPVAADGFDQRFGLAADGAGGPGAAVKQGWMCCVQGARSLHSVGVADGLVVVLLSEAPSADDPAVQRAALDAAARAALDPR